ncbi:hypothetical protein [Rhizosaccharibacter radicis]|uniref:PEGA domain-containing protein n=1 Tax=Rhizosaccharibacter radicis TaxID=2782605 RepID=A0ABT1VY55_9PROT|nr:hypothetical protein [Acetobacteraceae bacterium KSS12]
MPPADQRSRHRDKAVRRLWQALLVLGAGGLLWSWLVVPPTTLVVDVASGVRGTVLVDGREAGRPGDVLDVRPGRHVVELRSDGWSAHPRAVTLPERTRSHLRLATTPRPARLGVRAAPPDPAAVVTATSDGGTRRLPSDGTVESLPPGRYRIRAWSNGRMLPAQEITLAPGEERTLWIGGTATGLAPAAMPSGSSGGNGSAADGATASGDPTRIVAPAGGRWSDPVVIPPGRRFFLSFEGAIRVRGAAGPILLDDAGPVDLGVLPPSGLAMTAVGDRAVAVTVRTVAPPP